MNIHSLPIAVLGFNEAEALKPRIDRLGIAIITGRAYASMRPRR